MKLMTKLGALAIVSLMALTPLAVAHFPARPVLTCESNANVHEFALGTGRLVGEYQDGNADNTNCNGPTYGMFLFSDEECAGTAGDPAGSLDPVTQNGDPFNAIALTNPSLVYTVACQTDRPADWDGDLEWAVGGAVLAHTSGALNTPSPQSCVSGGSATKVACAAGAYDANDLVATTGNALGGANNCWDMDGHHLGDVYAQLDTVGASSAISGYISLTVTSNFRRAALDGLTPDQESCGDTVNEPCPSPPLATTVDQVNCNGRDGKVEFVPALLTAADITLGTYSGPATVSPTFGGGQDGVWIAFVGSVGCPISQTTSGACVPPPNPTAGWTGHIWT